MYSTPPMGIVLTPISSRQIRGAPVSCVFCGQMHTSVFMLCLSIREVKQTYRGFTYTKMNDPRDLDQTLRHPSLALLSGYDDDRNPNSV